MKIKLITILLFLTSLLAFGQRDITVLNGYKYVYLAPLEYQDGSSDVWGIRSQIKDKLISSGLSIIETTTAPQNMDGCFITVCIIEHTNNVNQAASDYVNLKFLNCNNQVIYSSQGTTGALVMSYQQGWRKATKESLIDFNSYRFNFDDSKTFAKQFEKSLPTLELTGLTEESIREHLTSNKIDPIEGIYKSYQNEGMPYYKIGIIKSEDKYKAVIIESELSYWKAGEVKAIFEPSSMQGFYSLRWYMGNKEPYETFGEIENDVLLSIELRNNNTGEKRQDKFIKMFPTASNKAASNKGDYTSSGSGFFVSKEGIIATNAHVINGADSNIEVVVSNEIGSFTYKAKVLLVDNNNDVALIKIDDEKFKGLTTIPYSIIENSEIGEKVFTIGYPLNNIMGANYKVTDGIVSSKSGISDDVRYLQVSVPLQPGNSGGPLFNKDGNIIGITSAKLNGKAVGTQVENVNYAIKSSYLLNLYNMLPNSAKIQSPSKSSPKELHEQVKVLKDYVCLIKVK